MTGTARRQRWTPGAVVRIDLGDGSHAYAMMLENDYAFFDVRAEREWRADEVVRRPVLFRLWVMRYAHSKGRWRKVGRVDVPNSLRTPALYFHQEIGRPDLIHLTHDGLNGRRVGVEDCAGLERLAVWDPEHVEDRLRDHFAGRPNPWVQSLALHPVN